MSEDIRVRRRVLYISNPSPESDGDDPAVGDRQQFPTSCTGHAPPQRRQLAFLPPIPSAQASSFSHPSQLSNLNTDLLTSNSLSPPSHPPLSSPSSTAEETPPPSTPGPSVPIDLTGTVPAVQEPYVSSSFNERGASDTPHTSGSRTGKFLQTLKAPFGTRGPRPVDPSRRTRVSPTTSVPEPFVSVTSPGSSSTISDRVLIVVTADSERYVTVDITGATNAAFIRECILNKLNHKQDEKIPFLIYQTEIGAYASGDALSDDRLFTLCRDKGDARGSLKFFVSYSSVPVHERPRQTGKGVYDTIVLPSVPSQQSPLRPSRRRSRSRQGSFSSVSEHLAQEVPPGSGYEADLDNNPDRETLRTRTVPQSQSQLTFQNPITHPASPLNIRRPSGPLPRPSSPLHPSVGTNSQSTLPDKSRALGTEPALVTEKPRPSLPVPPHPPPLSPYKPNLSIHDDTALSPPNTRLLHLRSGSDAGAEREQALKPSEYQMENPTRIRTREPIGRLKAEASNEISNQPKDLRQQKRYQNDRDDAIGRSDSWVLVSNNTSRSADHEPPPTSEELQRPTPSSSRNKGQQSSNSSRYRQPYTGRPSFPNSSRPRPSGALSSSHDSSRALPPPRQANIPIPSSFLVTWKGEESGRLGKGFTKSMDNLRAGGANSSSAPSARRNQLPPPLPTLSPSHAGLPQSYEQPRVTRPLPSSNDVGQPSTPASYGSRLHPSNQDPYQRPQSAAGDTPTSPSHKYPMATHISGYSIPFDNVDPSKSPRNISPSRPYPPPAVPGPRPRLHYSHQSDRSSDIQSGPETSNTTPPRTPISPQSPRYGSEKNGYAPEPSSPLTTDDMKSNRFSESTLKQEEHSRLTQILKDGTLMPHHVTNIDSRSVSPAPPSSGEASQAHYTSQDEYSSDVGGGTWLVPPDQKPKSTTRPPLKVQIDGPGDSPEQSTTTDTRKPHNLPIPPVPSLGSNLHRATHLVKSSKSMQGRRSTFTDLNDSWSPRPPPEDVYERLEEFFPEHDLDKPVIEANSGGTSPTSVEAAVTLAPPPQATEKPRGRSKKSIRIVAQEHKSRIDRTSRTDTTAYANNMLRKRNTKMWGSKLEEVNTMQSKSSGSTVTPDSPSGGPTTFKWVRGELIGKGTYGRVYLALNATTGEMIAVKQVEIPQTASDKNDSRQVSVVQALKSESETLKDLDHLNIVQYLGFEETPSNLSIFLEYVPGGSVGSCLLKHGKFHDNVTRSFTRQILSGLKYLHSKGILHRDLKADNILVEMSGICKISDFGISKRTDDEAGGAFTAMQGTVFWMAPEVINTQKKGYNFKIDIWSVGCVVLEMWAGMRPWIGEEMVAVMFKLYQSKLPPPVPEDVVLSELADDFRRKCFAMNPEERPSAAELRKHRYLDLPPDWKFTGFT